MPLLSNKGQTRRNNFDFLRLLLAFFVIYTHSFAIYNGFDKVPEPLYQWSHKQINLGNLAVNFFFVISGYLVTQSWFRSRNAIDYLKKRILRIYPAFIVVTLFLVFVVAPLGNASYSHSWNAYLNYLHKFDFGYLPQTILKLKEPLTPPTFIHQPLPFDINDSLWTISHEFICYLALMLLGVLGLLRSRKFILLVFVLSYLFMVYFQYFNTTWIYRVLPGSIYERLLEFSWLFAFFMGGVLFYTYREFILPVNWIIYLSPIIFLLAARYTNAVLSVQLFLGSYVMFCFAFSKKIKWYNTARYGDFSYGVYLYGWPVQQLIVYYFGLEITFFQSILAAFILVMPFAILSWKMVEKPFLNLKNYNLLTRSHVRKPV
jgi:peptidoglycan/LPS O-acetylase OafA/YrhL